MILVAPILLSESIIARIFGATGSLMSSFALSWFAFGKGLMQKKSGMCYAAIADVFASLQMADDGIYRQFDIGTTSAFHFLNFALANPRLLYTIFGYRRKNSAMGKYLPPGTLLLYPAFENARHGFSLEHGHIEIIVSGLFRIAASDHLRSFNSCSWFSSLEARGECLVLFSHSLGSGSLGFSQLFKLIMCSFPSLQKILREWRSRMIKTKYLWMQQNCAGISPKPIFLEQQSVLGYLKGRGFRSFPKDVCFIPRYSWCALEPEHPPEMLKQICRIVVHHSSRPIPLRQPNAGLFQMPHSSSGGQNTLPEKFFPVILELKHIQKSHLIRGMTDIGYHFLIGPFGELYEGRPSGKWVRGEHATRFNDDSVSICLLGNFDVGSGRKTDEISMESPAAITLKNVAAWIADEAGFALSEKRRINPSTANCRPEYCNSEIPVIAGHCELDKLLDLPGVTTSCPGSNLMPLVRQLRCENVPATAFPP